MPYNANTQASRHITLLQRFWHNLSHFCKCAKIISMDATAIITTTITAVASTFVAISNVWMNSQRKKDKEEAKAMAERNAAKSAILNMITQDIIRVEVLKKSPENYQAILKEYDWYTKNGGNSYIKAKVRDYLEWQEKDKKQSR